MRGLLVGGNCSGSGKTGACIALGALLRQKGLRPLPLKTGPDFIDAAWLARACDAPCLNYDIWMGADAAMLAPFAESADFLLAEGAMGLFDGAENGAGSSVETAAALGLPILLILSARGLGQSIGAVTQGFLNYMPENLPAPPAFCGVAISHPASARHERMLKNAAACVCAARGVDFLGFLPKAGAPAIAPRHLGLTQACECDFDFGAAAAWLAANLDVERLLANAGTLALERAPVLPASGTGPRVAIARDAAFAFCYADLPHLLNGLGARVSYFSPLYDSAPPPCDAIYLPGGYPELYAQKLVENTAMLAALRHLAARGTPIYGECGGYMYLLESITDAAGKSWPMPGLLPGRAALGKRLAAMGYREAVWPFPARGHEFHYAVASGETAPPLWRLRDAGGGDCGPCGQRRGNVSGSWLHLYPQGSRLFWQNWLAGGKNA